MSQKDDLTRFVRDGMAQGHRKPALAEALQGAGWSKAEVADALEAFADTPFSPPVPRPRNMVSARDFFVYALMFSALVAGSIYLVIVLHTVIDILFGEDGRWRLSTIRTGLSVLIVTVPVYFWLTLNEGRRLAADPGLYRSAIRKWMVYVALLIAALVLGTDLIATVNALLEGEFTGQFALKAAVVAGVSGGIFAFYLRQTGPKP